MLQLTALSVQAFVSSTTVRLLTYAGVFNLAPIGLIIRVVAARLGVIGVLLEHIGFPTGKIRVQFANNGVRLMTSVTLLSASTASTDNAPQRTPKKAAFFDRDGTLIYDAGYLDDISKIKVLPHVIDGLLQLQAEGFVLYVVTNQSGIGRNLFTHDFVGQTHEAMRNELLRYGIVIEKFLYCPHLKADDCCCRKPRLGLLEDIAVNWSASWMLGDKISDVQFGLNAGMRALLVHPNGERGVLFQTVPDMQKAVEVICANKAYPQR